MIVFLFGHVVAAKFLRDTHLEVSVNASWGEPSYVAQAINFFNEYQNDQYSCMISTFNSAKSLPTSINDTVELFSKCLTPFNQNFLTYLLRIKYFSPRVAFYTNISNVKQHKQYDFEPEYDCHQFVDVEKKITLKDNCIIRPILPENAGKTHFLHGYGVELRPFKYSMEYNIKDNAKTLSTKRPLHDDKSRPYVESLEILENRQPSARRLQKSFFSFVDSMDEDNKFAHLRDIAFNWPAAAMTIAATEIDKDVEKTVKESDSDVAPGTNLLSMNGRILPISTFDSFTFAKIAQEEMEIANVLSNQFHLTKPSITLLTELEIAKSVLSVDIRNKPIIWLNDLEKDKRYKKWTPKLSSLFGKLTAPPRIRKNLINIVLMLDPSIKRDFETLLSVQKYLVQGYGARFGIILTPHLKNETSVNISRAFSEIEYPKLFNFVGKLQQANTTDIIEAFKYAYENVTKRKWLEFSPSSSTFCQDQIKVIKDLGINAPALWINGRVYEADDVFDMIDVYSLEALKYLRDSITPEFGGDILEYVLSKEKSVPRKITQIHSDQPIPLHVKSLKSYANALFDIKYDLEDPEFPLVHAFVYLRSNKDVVKNKITKFFSEPHKSACRIAFFDKLPFESVDLPETDAVLIVNGRVIGVNSTFSDYSTLFDWQAFPQITNLFTGRCQLSFTSSVNDRLKRDLHCFWSHISLTFEANDVRRCHFHPNMFDTENPAVAVHEVENSPLQLRAVLDPFSRDFQKLIGFLAMLEKLSFVDVSLLMNPPEKLNSVPSSFYRFIDDDYAVFSLFNESITYSVIPDPPESWMIEQLVADVDLDNVLGLELTKGTYLGSYILSDIVLEGIALDTDNTKCDGAPLALYLGDKRLTDTIVMRNIGYWQLKAFPGEFSIRMPDDVCFKLIESTSRPCVASFAWGKHLLRMKRVDGNPPKYDAKDDGKIHLFIVASGHLYERLTKIMMLSCINHADTNTTAKFWLFRNFLSPRFKKTLAVMSERYHFEYEFVTYRWPSWLKRQTEKNRIAWGNKILFLDVLFPLSLKRVIYVDADQTLRVNMRELMTMDFQGAPYAFTPFCNSRKETEPFRFWKSGYWKEHLNGRPYHISALFAIDLNRFREMSAGDWLRYYYSALVGDSSSLSNLDQDLPNYAQDRIPIFSLPQNWLWCETWCSDDTMDDAKTIDLCNNPLTKSPKLFIAQTRIKEWPKLDEEARKIEEGILSLLNEEL